MDIPKEQTEKPHLFSSAVQKLADALETKDISINSIDGINDKGGAIEVKATILVLKV